MLSYTIGCMGFAATLVIACTYNQLVLTSYPGCVQLLINFGRRKTPHFGAFAELLDIAIIWYCNTNNDHKKHEYTEQDKFLIG